MANDDFEGLICRYPIRESSAISNIIRKLGFTDKDQYQATVRNIIKDNADALEFARNLFGSLYDDINKEDELVTDETSEPA